MDIDWKMLIGVRERQQAAALEAVAQRRRLLEASQAHALAAREQWQRQVSVKAAHWQALMATASGRPLSAQQLCDASAGSLALDAQIARAARAASQADAVVAEQQAQLDACRVELRAADAELMKARRMQERCQAQQCQARERQQEDAAEELSSRQWLVHRAQALPLPHQRERAGVRAAAVAGTVRCEAWTDANPHPRPPVRERGLVQPSFPRMRQSEPSR